MLKFELNELKPVQQDVNTFKSNWETLIKTLEEIRHNNTALKEKVFLFTNSTSHRLDFLEPQVSRL
jgi:hypothetical protein